jgi:hypothetical protein
MKMFRKNEHVVYFEHRNGTVRQHYGTVEKVCTDGTYVIDFEDLPRTQVYFCYLQRTL